MVQFCGGVRVHIIIDDKLVIYGSRRFCSQHFSRFPLLRRPFVVNVPFWVVWWASAHPCSCLLLIPRAQRQPTPISGFHREASTFGSLALCRETKFIIGFDVAVTLSSPASSCVLFDFASRQVVELKWLMLNKHKRWFHSSRVKFPCQYVCELVLGVNVFDLDLGSQIDSIKQPINNNSAGSGNMFSLWGFFPLWSSWSLLRHLQRYTTKLPDEKNSRLMK